MYHNLLHIKRSEKDDELNEAKSLRAATKLLQYKYDNALATALHFYRQNSDEVQRNTNRLIFINEYSKTVETRIKFLILHFVATILGSDGIKKIGATDISGHGEDWKENFLLSLGEQTTRSLLKVAYLNEFCGNNILSEDKGIDSCYKILKGTLLKINKKYFNYCNKDFVIKVKDMIFVNQTHEEFTNHENFGILKKMKENYEIVKNSIFDNGLALDISKLYLSFGMKLDREITGGDGEGDHNNDAIAYKESLLPLVGSEIFRMLQIDHQ